MNLVEINEAMENGFTLEAKDLQNRFGWSEATLARKARQMIDGVDYVFVAGKTRSKRLFKTNTQGISNAIQGEIAEPEQIAPVEAEKTAIVKAENQKVSKPVKNNQKVSANTITPETFSNALILPHKPFLSLSDAVELTGLSRNFLLFCAPRANEIFNKSIFIKLNGWKMTRRGLDFLLDDSDENQFPLSNLWAKYKEHLEVVKGRRVIKKSKLEKI